MSLTKSKPTCGPYARCGWDRRRGEWVVTLTREGRELVETLLAACDGAPVRLFNSSFPMLSKIAHRDHGQDEVAQACLFGVLMAAQRYEPDRGAAFATYVVPWLRATVQKLLYPWKRVGSDRVISLFAEDAETEMTVIEGIGEHDAPPREDVSRYLAGLDFRRRLVVEMRFGLNGQPEHSFAEIAGVFGVCKERVRQDFGVAVRQMAAMTVRTGEGVAW